MVAGPGDEEPEVQTFDSEDVSDSAPEKLLKVTEEKPERSKDSTIHTAHQFLMDISQVGYTISLLSATAGETWFPWPVLMKFSECKRLELLFFSQLSTLLLSNSRMKSNTHTMLYMQLKDAFKMTSSTHPWVVHGPFSHNVFISFRFSICKKLSCLDQSADKMLG